MLLSPTVILYQEENPNNMNDMIRTMLDVPYVRLKFELEMKENAVLPASKPSAFRGGMGQMLLKSCCVADRNCEACRFRKECIVQRIMYSPFAVKPSFVTEGESIGFIIICEDYRKSCCQGDILTFSMTLFGGTIVYFYQILQAFYMLGVEGLGKEKAQFSIRRVMSNGGSPLVSGMDIDMSQYRIRTLAEYVQYRKRNGRQEKRMKFHTPVSVKYMGEQIQSFSPEAVLSALCRRIYMLDCYMGINVPQFDITGRLPVMTGQGARTAGTARFSTRHMEKIHLNGIQGFMDLEDIDDDIYDLLLAGEITHIGKNTKFGFGRYTMLSAEQED
jgi:hypothetical protein